MNITLLTIALILVTFLAAFIRLWQSPPKLEMHLHLSGLQIPDRLALSLTHVPADIELKPIEEPIPEDILDYISQESETHAQDARKRRARQLKSDTGNWPAAFRLLQKEDNALDF